MAKLWMKLDVDWRDDPKVMDYEDRHGKAALVDLIGLFCCLAEFDGMIDLKEQRQPPGCAEEARQEGQVPRPVPGRRGRVRAHIRGCLAVRAASRVGEVHEGRREPSQAARVGARGIGEGGGEGRREGS